MSHICTPIHVLCPLVRSALCIARVRVHLVPCHRWQSRGQLEQTSRWTSLQAVTWSFSTPVQISRSAHPHTPPLPDPPSFPVSPPGNTDFHGKSLPALHGLQLRVVTRGAEAPRLCALHFQKLRRFFPPHALELVCASSEQSELNACKRWLLQPPQKKS